MCGSVQIAWTSLSRAVPMVAFECLTFGVSNTPRLSMSRLKRGIRNVRQSSLSLVLNASLTWPPPIATSPGNLSPTSAQQQMSQSPPLLRLAASPHDAHLLATFSQESNLIRVLDVRQPGQALLELRGHSSAISCCEWSPSKRGMLASGGDDSLVLVWDLLNQSTTAPGASNGPAGGPGGEAREQIPVASWQCDYEVGNLSWAPQSGLTASGRDWLGVSGGRGIWGVCM